MSRSREPLPGQVLAAVLIPLGLAFKALGRFLAGLRDLLPRKGLGSVLGLALLAAVVLTGIKVVPFYYARYELAHAAGDAAQQAKAVGVEPVLRRLNREAFKLGFTEAALNPETFQLEFVTEDGLDECAISYDFVQQVNLYGVARLPLRVRDRVLRPSLAVVATPDIDKLVQ